MRSALLSMVLTVFISAGLSLAQAPRPRVTAPSPAIPPTLPAAGTAAPVTVQGQVAPQPQAPNVPRSVTGNVGPDTTIPTASSDEQPSEAAATDGLANQAEPVATAAGAKTWCDLYFSQSSAKDIAAFDQTGTYLADVREVNIWIAVATKIPQARLTSWTGVYKPLDATKLQAVDWRVRRIVTVPAEEFQRLVSGGGRPPTASK